MGVTVGNAVSSKQEETSGSKKRLSHLSCFIWLMGSSHPFIHPFFPSVSKDEWVPSECQVLKMQWWAIQVRSLPRGACSVAVKASFSAASPFGKKPPPVPLQSWGWLLHRVTQKLRRPPRGQGLQLLAAWSVPPCTRLPPFSWRQDHGEHVSDFSFLKSASKGVQGNWGAWWIKAPWKWITAQHGEQGDVLKGQTMPSLPCFSPMEVNWRSYFPQGVKLTRCWEFSKSAKRKKCHYRLSNQIDWWVVLSTSSLYLASDAKMRVKARSLYWKCSHLWAGGTNQHHCVFRGRNHSIPWYRLPQWPQSWIFTNYEVGNCQSLYKLIYLGIPSRWPVPSVL